jgi:hypothetical protein
MRRFTLAASLLAFLCAASTAAALVLPPRFVKVGAAASSAVHGTAVVRPTATGSRVGVRLAGADPGALLRVQLRTGTCARPSTTFLPVVAIRADGAGNAQGSGFVRWRVLPPPIRFASILEAGHVVWVAGSDGAELACGAVATR